MSPLSRLPTAPMPAAPGGSGKAEAHAASPAPPPPQPPPPAAADSEEYADDLEVGALPSRWRPDYLPTHLTI